MQRGSCRTSCGLNTGGKWSVLAQPGKGTESLIDRGALRAPYTCKALELRPKSGCCISSSECKWTACPCQGLKLIRHLACVMHILSQSNCYACHTMISGFLFLQVAIISSSLQPRHLLGDSDRMTFVPDVCSSHLQRKLKGFIKEECTSASAPLTFGSPYLFGGTNHEDPFFWLHYPLISSVKNCTIPYILSPCLMPTCLKLLPRDSLLFFCGFKHSYCPAYDSGREQAAIQRLVCIQMEIITDMCVKFLVISSDIS